MPPHAPEIESSTIMSSFFMTDGDLNCIPHACTPNTLSTEIYSQTRNLQFFKGYTKCLVIMAWFLLVLKLFLSVFQLIYFLISLSPSLTSTLCLSLLLSHSLWVYVCGSMHAHISRNQNRVSNPLELNSQSVVSHPLWCCETNSVLCKNSRNFHHYFLQHECVSLILMLFLSVKTSFTNTI